MQHAARQHDCLGTFLLTKESGQIKIMYPLHMCDESRELRAGPISSRATSTWQLCCPRRRVKWENADSTFIRKAETNTDAIPKNAGRVCSWIHALHCHFILGRDRDLLRAGRSRNRIPVGVRFSATVLTCLGAHAAPYKVGTVKRPGLGLNHPPPSSAEVKERVELHSYFPSGTSWSVLGWT